MKSSTLKTVSRLSEFSGPVLTIQNLLRSLCLIFMLLLLSGIQVAAQRYPVRTYTEADGLANSMIYDLKQDSSGIIWIARRSGVSSYDGISFKNYNVSDGLKSTSYSFLQIDPKNKLWALVESGDLIISTYEGKRWKTISSRQGLKSIISMTYTAFNVYYQNAEPVVLVGSEKDGLFKFQNFQWTQYQTTDGLPSNTVNSILQFKEMVFVATDKGLSVMQNNGIRKNFFKGVPYLSKNILAMSVEGNVLYLLGESWLASLCEGKFTLISENFLLPVKLNGRHCFIQPDRKGRIYFGNMFKVFCYNQESESLESLKRNNGLISEGGSSVLVDREFNTWISGYRGITKIQSRQFASFYDIDGLFSNEVASGLEYRPGNYVFGHDGVLSFYDGRTFSPLILDHTTYNRNYESRVLDIAKDFQGNLWAAVSSKGLARIDLNRKIYWYRSAQGLDGIVFSVLSSSDGKLYAGTTTGLYVLTGDRFVKIHEHETRYMAIRKIYPGKGKSIFISTISWGIMEVRNDKVIRYRSTENDLANNVFSFLIDSKSRKWVGTAAGLYLISDTMLVRSGTSSPNINRPIYLILEDNVGRLWFGTDHGIYRWDEKTLDHFSTSEGISGQEINRSAGFMDFRHRLWFGTNNGLTVYDPVTNFDPKQVSPPLLSLQYLESGKDTLNPAIPLRLPSNMNNLIFHFRAISFIDEKLVVYKYKLDGLDTSWSNDVFYLNNSVRYNNLKPGTYRFCVKARNSLGVWCDPVCSSVIKVKQPFWFSWWFLMTAIIILGVIGFLTGRYVLIIRYNVRLEKMVSERTKELEHSEQMLKESNQAKDNFFSIIAHDLKSPFNVILGMLELLTKDYSEYSDRERQVMLMRLKTAATRTIDLLENLLTWARVQKGLLPFSPEKFDMLDIVHENIMLFESAAHSKDILIKQSVEKNLLVMADRNMINTIVRNLISNAIKFTFPGGSITINVGHQETGQILVSVKDTGFGMSPNILSNLFKIEKRMVTRGTNNEMGTGLGLILSKDFIEKNNGKIWVSSEEGAGSTFYFTLPLEKSS
ncbi:MAG: ATP-binding protein [Bacteroidetes bacterium]|nr:ATP-binding protein [Bacteroidota bacterium]